MAEASQTNERILRVLECCERSFTTSPRRRIGRGHTITIRRIYEIAKFLWDTNHRDKVTRADLETAIFNCVGADQRTMNRYIGRWVFSKAVIRDGMVVEPPRKIKYVKGYLERFKFTVPSGENTWELLWAVIPSHVVLEEASGTITNLYAPLGGHGSHKTVMERQVQRTLTTKQTTTHNTHTNQLGESIVQLQSRVQTGLTPAQKAVLEERDRKKLEAVEKIYLQACGKGSLDQP